MPTAKLSQFFDHLTWLDMLLWGLVFVTILIGIAWLLYAEKQQYARRGKGRGWGWMRLLALPMLAVSAATILMPARAISGPEALGYFYLALFTLGPLTWFGLHVLAGTMQTPRLSRSESLGLAVSGLAILIVPAIIISMAQGPIFMASHQLKRHNFAQAESAPLAHAVLPVQRFRLGEAGDIYAQTLRAPAGMQIERIDVLSGGHWHNTATMMHGYLCRQGEDLHLAWTVGTSLSPLRIYWRNTHGKRVQADYTVPPAALAGLPAQDFVVGWRDDGIDLPVPLMRDTVQLDWSVAPQAAYYRSLNPLQPGENFVNDCVMTGYRRVAWQQEGPIQAVMLRFHPKPPTQSWQSEFRRASGLAGEVP